MPRLDMRWGVAMAVMVLAMPAPAFGQRLLETDGIELHGTARVVTYAASLCNVLEASHTEAEYERIKANHGQPLDVWQLDFSVYNGSGRWLDHLIALYSIESKWPDCTNWSGDGPGGGPSGTYSEPVQWTGTAGHIQETGRNVVAPGATLTATTFILVFHEDPPPQFADWSVNFRFGKPVTAGGSETGGPGGLARRIYHRGAATGGGHSRAGEPCSGSRSWTARTRRTSKRISGSSRTGCSGRWRRTGWRRCARREGVEPVRRRAGSRPAADRDVPQRAGELRVFDGMEFVGVPAGEFRMGSASPEAPDNVQPVTQVRISRGFRSRQVRGHTGTVGGGVGIRGAGGDHRGIATRRTWPRSRGARRIAGIGRIRWGRRSCVRAFLCISRQP